MAKRRRDTLTGGTGDVKPQILTISSGTPASLNDYTVQQHSLPVPRFTGQPKDTSTVFELLSADWYLGLEDISDTEATNFGFISTIASRATGDTVTFNTLADDANNPNVLALAMTHRGIVTTGRVEFHMPIHIDLTDGAGNGVLIATDRIFIVAGNSGGTAVARATVKLLYRQTNISVIEYIGIVQSQQG